MSQQPLVSVVCCAHNEEEYVDRSMLGLLESLKGFASEIIFVADRCTDNTVEKVRKYEVKVIEKSWKKWENSYAESLQTGYLEANGAYLSIIDADIAIPVNFFRELLPMIRGDVASVAARVVTYSDTFWNRLFYAWEKTHEIAPLGREPRGAARLILKSALDEINGFRDVPTPDTDIDLRLAKRGCKSVAESAVKVYHLRHLSLAKMVGGQINSGRGRYALGVGLVRTIGHSIFRFRPLVICGWLLARQRDALRRKK
jgi:glycosyltransferase involved in cell wall biosynthesis